MTETDSHIASRIYSQQKGNATIGKPVGMLSLPKHENDTLQRIYGDAMSESVRYKTQFFGPLLEELIRLMRVTPDNPLQVADLGSCSSALAIALSQQFGDSVAFAEIDLDPEFTVWARQATSQLPEAKLFRHIHASASEIPLPARSMDVVMTSSAMHEFYSYPILNHGPYSRENVCVVMREMHRILKPFGYVFDRDYVAKPKKPDEMMVMIPSYADGCDVNSIDELKSAEVGRLNSKSALDRFLLDFGPAAEFRNLISAEDNVRRLPAWLVGEALFHLGYRNHGNQMWESEMYELYGQMGVEETKKAALECGFCPVSVNAQSHYDVAERNYRGFIFDEKGNGVNTKERFPTNIYSVLLKPPGYLQES